jgi:hypothetical protein
MEKVASESLVQIGKMLVLYVLDNLLRRFSFYGLSLPWLLPLSFLAILIIFLNRHTFLELLSHRSLFFAAFLSFPFFRSQTNIKLIKLFFFIPLFTERRTREHFAWTFERKVLAAKLRERVRAQEPRKTTNKNVYSCSNLLPN